MSVCDKCHDISCILCKKLANHVIVDHSRDWLFGLTTPEKDLANLATTYAERWWAMAEELRESGKNAEQIKIYINRSLKCDEESEYWMKRHSQLT